MLLHGVSSIKQDLFGLMLHIPLQFHMLNTFRACRSRCAEFPDEHEIRPAELQAAMQWLEEILGAGKPGVKIAFAPRGRRPYQPRANARMSISPNGSG